MAITTAFCNEYKLQTMIGAHASNDVVMLALYATCTLDADTTVYSTVGESTGTGYTEGGVTLTGYTCTLATSVAIIDFADAAWTTATVSALGCMLYNQTLSNKAIAVIDFGGTYNSTAGTFTVAMPAATSAAAILRLA